jgi:hypothetical protein
MKRFTIITIAIFSVLWLNAAAHGQCVSLTTPGSASTQNFDTLSNTAGSTTNPLTIPGWFMTESGGGARDNEQYGVDTGASTTGDTYSYGAAAATDRALGQLRSGTLIPIFGACYTNNTGTTLSSLAVAYTGEEWRLGTAARTDQMNFEYSTNATDLVTGTWTNVAALNFVTPDTATVGAKNGNAAADRTALSSTIPSLNIPNGATFWIRWTDTDATGADDGLAIDDFSLTPQAAVIPPNLTVDDVSLNEGNAGTTSFTFTVSLSTPAPVGGVTFNIATADGTAVQPADYTLKSLTSQTIPVGGSTYSFTVLVNGDTTPETNETFFVNVTNVTGANVTDGQGQGTIVNDDVAPNLSINDVSLNEGNAGTTTYTFTVSLSAPAPTGGVTFDIGTADGTAAAPADYTTKTLTTQTIPVGGSTYTFDVLVNGDTGVEPDETFFVNVTNVSNAVVTDGQGQGTIVNDDTAVPPALSFEFGSYNDDESQTLTVGVTRSGDLSGTSTVDYSTQTLASNFGGVNPAVGGAACTAGVDFINNSGTLTFAPKDEFRSFDVVLCGDTMNEPDELFNVILTNPMGGTLGEISSASVTINDTASQFTNTQSINFGGEALPYPATINVTEAPPVIGSVRVTLYDFFDIGPDDLDMLLVGPQGQNILLMADAGGSTLSGGTLTFQDNAGQVLPDNGPIVTGKFEPTSWEPGQTSFPPPFGESPPPPPAPYNEPGSTLGGPVTLASVFNGTNPNGQWRLYVRVEPSSFQPLGLRGQIAGGWGLQLLAPSAAGVSVSGQVRAGKSGISNATVTISGGNLSQPKTTRTNSFGNYTFDGLTAGQTYVVTVAAKRYAFTQPSIVLNVTDSIANADFEAEGR